MASLSPKITQAGLALFPQVPLPGFQVKLTHIAIGTARYVPTGEETALQAEVARYPVLANLTSKPAATSVQVGVNITSQDPQGRSPDEKWIGEIGFYSDDTLFAVWSQQTNALFYKSAEISVPFAYTLDVSVLPAGSVTVVVSPDAASMQALLFAHELAADPHPQYFASREEVLPGGLTGQVLTKQSNAANDWKWADLTDGLVINTNTQEEPQVLAAGQVDIVLTKVTTNGVVLFIGGARLDPDDFTKHPTDLTRLTLKRSWPAGTKLLAAQNEVAGQIIDPLQASRNLSDVKDKAVALANIGGMPLMTGVPLLWPTQDCPSYAVVRDGSALSRTAYSALYLILAPARSATITMNAGGAVVSGLSRTSDLWVGMPVEHASLPAGTTIKSIDSTSQVTLTANSSATTASTLARFFLHGYGNGGGSTTFGVMDDRGLFERAADGNRGYDKTVFPVVLTASSKAVTGLSSTRGLYVGQNISASGIPAGAVIESITSSNSITISQAATGGGAVNMTVTGRPVGSEEDQSIESHNHINGGASLLIGGGSLIYDYQSGANGSRAASILPYGGAETRPKNRSYLPIIVY